MDQRAGKKHQSRVPIPDVNDHLRGPVLLRELEGCAHFNNQSKVAAAILPQELQCTMRWTSVER
jgi:pyrimidine deaminase RibD-like protein